LIVTLEKFRDTYQELEPLYRKHYAEMQARLAADGVTVSDYNPRLDQYEKFGDEGWLLTFVLRDEGQAIGYSNIYVTADMHNHDKIAQEDTIFVLPERRGVGRVLIRAVHDELKKRGCKRLHVTTMTDLRVSKLLQHMGYKHTAHHMTMEF
jgi:GNAT superfamily N-acetyltransferase